MAYEPFPVADPALLVEESVTCVVQVGGKVRDRIEVPPSIGDDDLRERALASEAVQRALDGRGIRTVVVRAPSLVNVVPFLMRSARCRYLARITGVAQKRTASKRRPAPPT